MTILTPPTNLKIFRTVSWRSNHRILYFVVQIIFAGYAFIASQGDEKTMESSRKRLTEAVLGLAVVVVAVGMGSLIASLLGISNALDINAMFRAMGL
jgi:hypothetical protein